MQLGWALVLITLTAAPHARANDTNATLGAGGLVPAKSSAIVMESEDLQVTPHRITIKYSFRNVTNRDQDLIVAFPLPEMDGGAMANILIDIPSRDPLNFVDFEVFANGRRVEPKVELRAFFYGSEITGELRSLGLPLSVLDPDTTAAVGRLRPEQRASLVRRWVDCSLTRDKKCWPQWQTRAQFYWTQHFPASSVVEIEHTYRPIVGGAWIRAENYAVSNREEYCPTADALAQLRREIDLGSAGRKDGAVRREREIRYILTTANNWSGPIRNFHLSIIPDSAGDLVMTCMPGLKRTAPTRYELVKSNFRPDRELQIMILAIAP